MKVQRKILWVSTWVTIFTFFQNAVAQNVPFDQDELVQHLDQELSGEAAKRNLEYISRLHRMRGSEGYNQATEFIAAKLAEYHLESIETIKIPADGVTRYGTQKSRPAWNVEFAQLWEMKQQNGEWVNTIKIADWESIPLVVAQDSESGEAIAELVDIGAGISEGDYEGKEIQGKLVLTSSQPESVVPLAIEKYGAVGIISYAQNQVTAWWKENENLIRWGHLDTFSKTKTFGFMVSLKQARAFQERLKKGERIQLHAKLVAQKSPASYNILTAVIEGSDAQLKDEEIVYTCHLDHPRPGANDNASGCVAILEVARTLKQLLDENKIARPRRTLRFVWSPEIEGTTALLNYRPELAQRAKANIHMDMVGGGPETKAIFHVSRSPQSLPNFITDVGMAFGNFLNESSKAYASGEETQYPMVSKEGGKEALHAVLGNFHMGSDFEVFSEGSFRIPSIYLHDWPDRYIHTNYDVAANIDPTKLKRSSFIGAASGYFLGDLSAEDIPLLAETMKRQLLIRANEMLEFGKSFSIVDAENMKYYFWKHEEGVFESLKTFADVTPALQAEYAAYLLNLKEAIGRGQKQSFKFRGSSTIYSRNDGPKGPMSVFGYDYFMDHYDSKRKLPALLSYSNGNRHGSEYAYEALNLVNGKNTVQEIRNQLSAEFGPVPIELVVEYLEALESIQVIYRSK